MFKVGQGTPTASRISQATAAPRRDELRFEGYGGGATFTPVNTTAWLITFNGGASTETLTFTNRPAIDGNDYTFT